MKVSFKYYILAASIVLGMTSCDDYLDKMPDNRTELDETSKIQDMLVSCYPTTHYAAIAEFESDNTDHMDVLGYTSYKKIQDEASEWKDITYEDDDSPFKLWNDCYHSIASANMVLEAIEKQGNPAELQAAKGEALVARAFNHFILVNIFSKAYSPKTSSTDLGIPYVTKVETTVAPHYERGTVADVYKHIEGDLLAGIPLLDEASYSVPAYHFTKKAAEALAARFYLFYVQDDKSNYDKVIKYAQDVLTSNPLSMLREWKEIGSLSPNNSVRANAFVNADRKSNLLLCSTNSLWVRYYGPYGIGYKYCHNTTIAATETNKATTLWGSYSRLNYKIYQYTSMPKVIMDKFGEFFEITDAVNDVGVPHEMFPALTSDEVMLNMIEAYIMKKDYDKALTNFNIWMHNFTSYTKNVTMDDINRVYGEYQEDELTGESTGMKYYTPTEPTPKKELHPDFTVEKGNQENFLQCLLHCRRIMTLHEGLRWFDIKRYGMTIYRRTIDGSGDITVTDTMNVDDPRRAIQLPASVIKAGLEANPRK